ncbi:formiminotransferase N-terminal subdomain-containing protein isoform X2 [Austrofundulus limnaeus]|uniref:Formiminotransferase N-terminal subdomain-containing protein isoform X2 n=1 Tax=Austrofundulus limnaeus TaxID=52670 RepID=A0A2I4BZT1_AUSLI|nr:PREDICTED: formimidoyltransferase-cyclodeaminase-like isoform X2 [Austrofundulus limnaeus]
MSLHPENWFFKFHQRNLHRPPDRNMSSTALGRRLVACLLNVSEARRKDVVESVARAALLNSQGEAVLSACQKACSLIDMNDHLGVHPCLGAVDLVPIYPLGEDVGVEMCAQEAQAVAQELTERVPGSSVFLFGWADSPLRRGLAVRRKEMGWFRKNPDLEAIRPDVGPEPQRRFGLTGVGAGPYVMNCNVTIDTRDVALGRSVAAAIRGSTPGGLPGVQVLALPHEGAVEIACNVESMEGPPPSHLMDEPWPCFSVDGRPYCHAPAALIAARVAELAGSQGVGVRGVALVGFTPHECRDLAELALSRGMGEFWKQQGRIRM